MLRPSRCSRVGALLTLALAALDGGAAFSIGRVAGPMVRPTQSLQRGRCAVPGRGCASVAALSPPRRRINVGMAVSSPGAGIPAPGSAVAAAADAPAKWKQTAKVGFFLLMWYALNVQYNIYNKRTLNMISMPWILSTVQLAVGSAYVSLIWALRIRKAPNMTKANIKAIAPLALLHTLSHICAVVALGAGAVGFVHIVKAGEPLFTALFSGLFLGQFFSPLVYATLIPVVVGVALASLKELTFSWVSFAGAMGSNVAAASRGVLAKASMDEPKGENMDAGNLYGVMTMLATLMLAPAAAIVEGPRIAALLDGAWAAGHTSKAIMKGTVLSGLFFYLYNEVAFYCLNAIHPITHAVANTIKRVVLIAVSVVVFNHQLTPLGLVGSGVAIAGVLLYSLAKNFTANKKD